jgi:parvulin-like peptidyl-prolyl isomerase
MIKQLRQRSRTRKPVASRYGRIFIALLAVALFTFPAQAADVTPHRPIPASSPESVVLAKVNGEPITEQQVLRRLQAVHGDVEPYRQDPNRWQRMREAGIEAEIRDRLLLQAAIAEKLQVSGQELQEARARSEKLLGEERFRSMLQKRGATETDYDAFLRERLLIDKYKSTLFKDVSVDEETLRSYYDGHQELFTQPRRAHLESVLVEDREAAREFLTALESGDVGGTLPGKQNDTIGSAEKVQRRWVVIDALPPELRAPLDAATAGDVLEPVEEAGQTRIIRVLAVEKARPLSFAEARDGLQATLLHRRQETLLDDWYAQAIKQASIEYRPLP